MKIAPEHTEDRVLALMGKPGKQSLIDFKKLFDKVNGTKENKKYLTYYLIAAHPGCDIKDMKNLKNFTTHELRINPEQAQIFTPTPGTYSAVMYYTGLDPKSKKPIFVEKNMTKKEEQKAIVVAKESFGKNSFSS
ncbi:Putative radical SAM domain-containing protein (fragment) [Sulfurovum sp. enrichment culture clone C5]|uniref:Putative radical SAM domain-containing protein n=1 Tax=Sulfurovum sp. enrichment culture clone C5 TaxID=497650 RepID=A0A0S4XQA0_9BACT